MVRVPCCIREESLTSGVSHEIKLTITMPSASCALVLAGRLLSNLPFSISEVWRSQVVKVIPAKLHNLSGLHSYGQTFNDANVKVRIFSYSKQD